MNYYICVCTDYLGFSAFQRLPSKEKTLLQYINEYIKERLKIMRYAIDA